MAQSATPKAGQFCAVITFDLDDGTRADIIFGDDEKSVIAVAMSAIDAGTGDNGGYCVGMLTPEAAKLAHELIHAEEDDADMSRTNELCDLLMEHNTLPYAEDALNHVTYKSVYAGSAAD